MPKRSNEFQRLVFLIQQQIQDGKVTESAMLRETHGTGEREVDVYVEANQAGVPIRIAFECSKSGRKLDRTWVDGMVNKHKNLPTDKLVLVSKAGFWKPALEYAAKQGAEAVTFEEAEAVDWGGYFENLRSLVFGLFEFSGKPKTLSVKKVRAEDPDFTLDVLPEGYRNSANGQKGKWSSFLSAVLRSPDAARILMDFWFEGSERPIEFVKTMTVNFPDDNNRIDSRGVEYILETLVMEVTVSVDPKPLELHLSSFMGTGVGYGKARGFAAGDAEITVTARPGAKPVVSVSLGEIAKTGVIEMQLAEPESKDD